ncbi:MAG TPA: hypothetical protein VE224_18000 [Pseudolabrys sp.]|nr:hypothetical protein [Pseudolabrys sp.]
MTKTRAILLCGTAAVLSFSASGQASVPAPSVSSPALNAASYADLLAPISNASALLALDNIARTQAAPQARVQLARGHHHHHSHHHHSYHHHHHSHFPWGVFRGVVEPPPYYGPDCYWTWGHAYWNGYRWVRRRVRVCE